MNDVIPARPRDPAPTQQEISDALDKIVADGIDQPSALSRALVTVLVAEFNRHTTLEAGIFDAVANASSLADLKTRMAALNQVPQRALGDLRTAIRNALGS